MAVSMIFLSFIFAMVLHARLHSTVCTGTASTQSRRRGSLFLPNAWSRVLRGSNPRGAVHTATRRVTILGELSDRLKTNPIDQIRSQAAPSPLEAYELVRYVGQGRFSIVFEARSARDNVTAVIKVMKSPDASKLAREVQVLRRLGGAEGVAQLREVIVDGSIWEGDDENANNTISTASLIFNATPGAVWHSFSHQGLGGAIGCCPGEVRVLMRRLLRALRDCHARGIMHRDVKPENVLVDPSNLNLQLIDFGLSHQKSDVSTPLSTNVCSRHFKAPELLLGHANYNSSIDIWAAGCIFAGLLFGEEPFFASGQPPPPRSATQPQEVEEIEDLSAISSVLGSTAICNSAGKLGVRLSQAMRGAIGAGRPRTPWSEYVRAAGHALAVLASSEALDLLDRMLTANPGDRYTAEECLAHPYFSESSDVEMATEELQVLTGKSTQSHD